MGPGTSPALFLRPGRRPIMAPMSGIDAGGRTIGRIARDGWPGWAGAGGGVDARRASRPARRGGPIREVDHPQADPRPRRQSAIDELDGPAVGGPDLLP